MIKTYNYSALMPGPAVLAFGGIHGNEICGIEAISRLIGELDSGVLELKRGSVTLVPACNPEARRQDRRFIEVNLNRVFTRHENPQHYEEKLANVLTGLVAAADSFLDLHDVPAGREAFTFIDFETPENIALTRAMRLPVWITGWPKVFETCPSATISGNDTQAYAHSAGTSAVLVECGKRKSPESIAMAYQCLRRFLAHHGIIDFAEDQAAQPTRVYRIEQLIWKETESSFTRDWQHLDDVTAGEVIATYADGRQLTAPWDGKIIIPSAGNPVGHEWYYLGRLDPAYA